MMMTSASSSASEPLPAWGAGADIRRISLREWIEVVPLSADTTRCFSENPVNAPTRAPCGRSHPPLRAPGQEPRHTVGRHQAYGDAVAVQQARRDRRPVARTADHGHRLAAADLAGPARKVAHEQEPAPVDVTFVPLGALADVEDRAGPAVAPFA